MLGRYFELEKHGTTFGREVLGGTTTFLTMAYIVVVQPAVLSGEMSGAPTGMDSGSVMVATCLAAAIATALMGLLAKLPVAQAPGMGLNFIFVGALTPSAAAMVQQAVADGQLAKDATTGWQVALGVVMIAGVAFFIVSLLGLRQAILGSLSKSMWSAISVGIGLFIAFIGLHNAGIVAIHVDPKSLAGTLEMNRDLAGPDALLFFIGLFVTGALYSRKIPGAILWGMGITLACSLVAKAFLGALPETVLSSPWIAGSALETRFAVADGIVAAPPSLAPTFFQMDIVRACWKPMIPFIFIFLYMDVFDTSGTLAGVLRHANLTEDGQIPRARQAFISDAVGTVAGAAFGTSTVTSYIESAAGVQQGARTGLASLVTAGLFLLALFFAPVVFMMGSYGVITAPALVLVGGMMMANVRHIEWDNTAEALPAFITLLAIPLTYSIANGMALGFIAYPFVKLLAGQGREVKWLSWLMAAVLIAYLAFVW